MSKYADIEQIKEVIRTEWVKYMPMDLDMSLSFVLGKIAEVPTIDIVRCKDCKWYEKPHIKYNDGTRKYFDSELEVEFVTADIGLNVGGRCIGHKTYCTAHDRENPDDYEELVIFRNTDDFCSYGERIED